MEGFGDNKHLACVRYRIESSCLVRVMFIDETNAEETFHILLRKYINSHNQCLEYLTPYRLVKNGVVFGKS